MKGQGNYTGNECSKMVLNFKHGQVHEKERKRVQQLKNGERQSKNQAQDRNEVRLYN